MSSSHVFAITALFSLLIPASQAGNYQPLPGSFRPPSPGNTSTTQSGFPPAKSRPVVTPSQQQAWTSQPYGNSPNYYQPAPQVAPQYPQQNTSSDTWNRSISVNPGNFVNDVFGLGSSSTNNQAPTYYQQPAYQQPTYQPPVYQPPTQPAPVYQQPYHYGSTYPHPERYNYSVPPVQPAPAQAPVARPFNPPAQQQPAPFTSRPFSGEDTRFRPPELQGMD